MYYLLLTASSGLAIAFLLWRKAIVDRKLSEAQSNFMKASDSYARAMDELRRTQELYSDQLARANAECDLLRKQRQDAINALEKSNTPGNLRDALRLQLGVPLSDKPDPTKP